MMMSHAKVAFLCESPASSFASAQQSKELALVSVAGSKTPSLVLSPCAGRGQPGSEDRAQEGGHLLPVVRTLTA